jgi:Pentapeptide repeats (8 copies)
VTAQQTRRSKREYRDGDVLKSFTADPIYLIVRGRRRHIPDFETFIYLRFDQRNVMEAAEEDVAAIPLGPGLPTYMDRAPARGPAASADALPTPQRRSRWWMGLAMLLFAIAVVATVILITTAEIPLHRLTPAQRAAQIASLRASIIQSLAGIALVANFYVSFQALQISRATLASTVEAQVSERYAKSLELVDRKNNPEMRLGGIIALESIGRTSAPYREAILAFLTSLLPRTYDDPSVERRTPAEIVGILRALGTMHAAGFTGRVSVARLVLEGIEADSLKLPHSDLSRARWDGVAADRAVLSGASLPNVEFGDVDLRFSHLDKLMARGGTFSGCDLSWSNLEGAVFIGADLSGASLVASALNDAVFIGADLSGANLRRTDLSGADLSDAELDGAVADRRTVWPPGFSTKGHGIVMAVDPSPSAPA